MTKTVHCLAYLQEAKQWSSIVTDFMVTKTSIEVCISNIVSTNLGMGSEIIGQ